MNFCINCVEITGSRNVNRNDKLYKNLLNGKTPRFFFNDFYHHDQYKNLKVNEKSLQKKNPNFFSKRINIQAVVGKNGSGKSTLMDLVYAAINNFAFSIIRGQDKDDGEFLLYIPGLWLDIHFCLDISQKPDLVKIKNFLLRCQGDKIFFYEEIGNEISELNHYVFDFEKSEFCVLKESFEYKNISKYFFYTIVSNYSMQSFISSNYVTKAYRINEKLSTNLFSIEEITDAWIDKIFHKNDSYLRPIVINPFRGSGVIDLNNEINLSKDRLTAILIYAKQQGLISTDEKINLKYCYKDLKVTFNDSFLPQKLNKMYYDSRKVLKSSREVAKCVQNIAKEDDFKEKFKEIFNYQFDFGKNRTKDTACAYLLFKIYWISEKYAHYSDFKGTLYFNKERRLLEITDKGKNKLSMLLKEISNDFSHVTKKFWRTLNFLYSESTSITSYNNYTQKLYVYYSKRINKNAFAYTPFKPKLPISKGSYPNFISPVDIDFSLPPSIFDYKLIMKKEHKDVFYNELSSGELQLLQTLSIHIYHIENLISIIEGNSKCCNKYTNINLVFDEVEICFHPRQQQKFIQYLLDWFNMLRIAKDVPKSPLAPKQFKPVSLNIIILTHSPFILSDIPSDNIMYMNEGEFANSNQRQTYAANVNQLLFDSFFLGEGYTGEFAKKKIMGLIYYLTNDKSCFNEQYDEYQLKEISKEWDNYKAKDFITNYIGDDLLKLSLLKLLDKKRSE